MIFLAVALCRAETLDLRSTVAEALERGPGVQIVAAMSVEQRGAASAGAAWRENPTIAIDHTPGDDELAVEVPLDLGAPARAVSASHQRDAAELRADAARTSIAIAVAVAYLEAVRADEAAAIAGNARDLALRLGDAARRLFESGEVARPEAAVAEADAARTLELALRAVAERDAARMRLEVLLGREPTGELTPAGWPLVSDPGPVDPAEVPAVLAVDREARAALAWRTAEWLERIPDVRGTVGWHRGADADGLLYGISVEIPLFAPGIGPVRRASGAAQRTTAEADQERLDAALQVRLAERALAVAREVDAAYAALDVGDASDLLARRWEAGELAFPLYLAQRNALVDALRAALDARFELARARLALWELGGRLPPEMVR